MAADFPRSHRVPDNRDRPEHTIIMVQRRSCRCGGHLRWYRYKVAHGLAGALLLNGAGSHATAACTRSSAVTWIARALARFLTVWHQRFDGSAPYIEFRTICACNAWLNCRGNDCPENAVVSWLLRLGRQPGPHATPPRHDGICETRSAGRQPRCVRLAGVGPIGLGSQRALWIGDVFTATGRTLASMKNWRYKASFRLR